MTEEAWAELEEAMKEGEIASIAQAHAFLPRRGISYTDPSCVGQLLKRHQVKLKTGRLRHRKADPREQQRFKKTLPRASGEKVSSSRKKPLKVLAFDEARFGLINWHKKRYCPKGFSPPYVVQRAYEWTYQYAAVDPTTGESFCLYLPGLDSYCLEVFLKHLAQAYADHRLVVALDGALSHTSKEIVLPQDVNLLPLPSYSPELNPVERWFQEFRRTLANKDFETIGSLQEGLTRALEPYWDEPARLRSLTGFA